MKIADRAVKKGAADRRQHRIAEIAVQGRHRPRLDAALEAVAHDEVVAGAQPLEKAAERGEIVAVVAAAHDVVRAACRPYAAEQRPAIATLRDIDNAGGLLPGVPPPPLAAALIGD